MRQVSWETSAGALIAFLDSITQAYMADLYTVTLVGGGVLRYTDADQAVTVNGNTFAAAPTLKRGRWKVNVGVAVDALQIGFAADSSVTVNGTPLLQFIAGGGLDGARVLLERAFSSGPGAAWVGTMVLFTGRVGDPTVDRYEATVPVNSDSELLNVMVPATLYMPGCGNTLFDAACGLAKASYAVSATVTTVYGASTWYAFGLSQPADYFALGWAVGVTGANAGVARTIKSFNSGVVVTVAPWPGTVAPGDTFTIYPGCDKQQATCDSKFSNLIHFRGYPYVPAPETIA